MALISCPECGKEISDKSVTCIHCGFPLESYCPIEYGKNVCLIDGDPFDLSEFLDYINDSYDRNGYVSDDEFNSLVDALFECCPKPGKAAIHNLIIKIVQTREIPHEHESLMYTRGREFEARKKEEAEKRRKQNQYEQNLVHCPKCDSTNVVTGQRGYSIITGFWGSNRTMNRCAKCGYKWEPRR